MSQEIYEDDGRPIGWDDLPRLFEDLRDIARRLLACEGNAQSVQTTDLVISALGRYGKGETGWKQVTWKNRKHFLVAMHNKMRHVLIDHARKRGKRVRTVLLDESLFHDLPRLVQKDLDLAIDVQAAIDELEERPRDGRHLAQVARHWIYADLSVPDIARLLEISERTVRRYWEKAKLLLAERLCGPTSPDAPAQ